MNGSRGSPPPWAEMVPDVLGLIFNRLTLEEKLQVIPRVCKSWRNAVEGPFSWEKIDIDGWITEGKHMKLDRMLRMLVTWSAGSFRELYVSQIDDAQLSFIADHARSLRVLSVKSSSITDSMVKQVAPKLSSLTTIDLSNCYAITARSFAAIGTNCGSLESLTWEAKDPLQGFNCVYLNSPLPPCHKEKCRAIARTMPKLKRLRVSCCNIGEEEVHQIISRCPALQRFNAKGCMRAHSYVGCALQKMYPNVKLSHDGR